MESIEQYNCVTDEWSTYQAKLPKGRSSFPAICIDCTLIFIS